MSFTPDLKQRRLINKDEPLDFPAAKPCPLEVGDRITLRTSRVNVGDRGMNVPVLEIEVTEIRRTRKGFWRVLYRKIDMRPRYLRRSPPRHGAADTAPLDKEGIERAAQASAYTSSLHAALDDTEPIPPHVQRRFDLEARRKQAEREDDTEQEKQQERAVRSVLRERLKGLKPEARAALLAEIRRLIDEHGEDAERSRAA